MNKHKTQKEMLDIIKHKINLEIKTTRKKMILCSFFSILTSSMIMLLNLLIIAFALYALTILIREIISGSIEGTFIILPTIVALFTILLFVFSILTTIYKVKNKSHFFRTILDEYQYLIIKLNEKTMTVDEAVNILNDINNRKYEINKINTKKLFKTALGG